MVNQRSEPITRGSAMGTGISYIQAGWLVRDREGEELGKVTRIDDDAIVIARTGLTTPDHVRIPRDLVAEEDDVAMQAILSVDADAADEYATDD